MRERRRGGGISYSTTSTSSSGDVHTDVEFMLIMALFNWNVRCAKIFQGEKTNKWKYVRSSRLSRKAGVVLSEVVLAKSLRDMERSGLLLGITWNFLETATNLNNRRLPKNKAIEIN